ncbi:MAG: hypothetical protein R2684_06095 [Pyrinomonadaceae bacterium]
MSLYCNGILIEIINQNTVYEKPRTIENDRFEKLLIGERKSFRTVICKNRTYLD